MMAYCQEIRKIENNFEGKDWNTDIYFEGAMKKQMSWLRSDRVGGAIPPSIPLHRLDQPSIKKEILELTGAVELDDS